MLSTSTHSKQLLSTLTPTKSINAYINTSWTISFIIITLQIISFSLKTQQSSLSAWKHYNHHLQSILTSSKQHNLFLTQRKQFPLKIYFTILLIQSSYHINTYIKQYLYMVDIKYGMCTSAVMMMFLRAMVLTG